MLLLVVLNAACAALSPLIAELIMLDISVPLFPVHRAGSHQCDCADDRHPRHMSVIGVLK